jgi:hypothetical protein
MAERVGFESHAHVVRVLSYATTVGVLDNDRYHGPPSEWTLRPLTKALTPPIRTTV